MSKSEKKKDLSPKKKSEKSTFNKNSTYEKVREEFLKEEMKKYNQIPVILDLS